MPTIGLVSKGAADGTATNTDSLLANVNAP